MGGPGLGRWKKPGYRTVDSCLALDANALAVMGCLRPGGSGTYPWPCGNGVVAPIRFRCEADRLFLFYTPKAGAGGTFGDEERMEIIPITRVMHRSGARRRGKGPISQHQLAAILRGEFGIRSFTGHPTGRSNLTRGSYRRSQFEDLWARLLQKPS
jgi:hypothetical protein